MEGPSLFLAAELLAPFIGEQIDEVGGNTKIGKERLLGKKILSIFSYGKYLFFQLDAFALRVHFLLFGSFEASVAGEKVTGDYPKKARMPRLHLTLKSGQIDLYSCSVKFIEHSNARQLCDFTTDIMSEAWDEKKALKKLKQCEDSEIADALLDQTIFAGVGNIIKNEVLLQAKILPTHKVKELSTAQLKQLILITRNFVFQFYQWRKNFELKKHYNIYRQGICKQCGNKVLRKKTGLRNRMGYVCLHCQK